MAQLDKIVKKKLDNFQVDYNPSHWAEMESMLDKNPVNPSPKNWKKYIRYAAGILVVSSVVIYFSVNNNNTDKTIKTSQNVTDNSNNEEQIISLPVEEKALTITDDEKITPKSGEIKNNIDKNKLPETNYSPNNEENKQDNNFNSNITNTSSNGSITKDQVEEIVFRIDTDKKTICEGESVYLTILKKFGPENVNYKWFVNGNLVNKGMSYELKGKTIGQNSIKVEAISSKTSSTSELEIEVIETPKFNVEIKNEDRTIEDPYTTLIADNPTYKYQWNYEGKISTGDKFVREFISKGNYDIEITAANKNCKHSVIKSITIDDDVTLAPNSFNPEIGKIGPAETFFPRALENYNLQFELFVYDFKGNEVYRTSEINPWNGRINNTGDLMPVGLYSWKLIVLHSNGISKYQGTVNLVDN